MKAGRNEVPPCARDGCLHPVLRAFIEERAQALAKEKKAALQDLIAARALEILEDEMTTVNAPRRSKPVAVRTPAGLPVRKLKFKQPPGHDGDRAWLKARLLKRGRVFTKAELRGHLVGERGLSRSGAVGVAQRLSSYQYKIAREYGLKKVGDP